LKNFSANIAGLLTLLFTDIVDSAKLKQSLGDREAVPVIQRHHTVIREILGQFSEGLGLIDSCFIPFSWPSLGRNCTGSR
jgi:hypothetical protein